MIDNYAIVRNIPAKFHSYDLRNYFSDAIENRKFKCFHFKHRPEIQKPSAKTNDTHLKLTKPKTTCCVFEASTTADLLDVIKKYHNETWIDSDGDTLAQKCFIDRIIITEDIKDKKKYFNRKEFHNHRRHAGTENFNADDLLGLSEMRPPKHVMPNGNIGTPTVVFLELIKRIISKLKLKFPKTGSNRRYGNVPHEYETNETTFVPKQVYTSTGEAIKEEKNYGKETTKESMASNDDSVSDDDGCEEWERHEALHSDVTSQERSKERLFEEKIELKWEKGGSGLVFYTDAQYWAEENRDFDEDTADDWDVDMSVYYGEKGDMDAQDMIDMRNHERLRHGLPEIPRSERFKKKYPHKKNAANCKRMAEFETHTKGIGSRLMNKYGWKEGNPLGVNRNDDAIKEPIEAEGQNARERKGFGYHGEKLKSKLKSYSYLKEQPNHRFPEPLASHSYNFPQFGQNTSSKVNLDLYNDKKRQKLIPGVDGIIITTNRDKPLDVDINDDIYRSQHDCHLKHRTIGSSQETITTAEPNPPRPAVVYTGSKLVKSNKSNYGDFFIDYNHPQIRSTSVGISKMNFVKSSKDT